MTVLFALRGDHAELESQAEERTAELSRANAVLLQQLEEPGREEVSLSESEWRLHMALSAARIVIWD